MRSEHEGEAKLGSGVNDLSQRDSWRCLLAQKNCKSREAMDPSPQRLMGGNWGKRLKIDEGRGFKGKSMPIH